MCLYPRLMYDVGLNPSTGKRKLVAKRPTMNPLYKYDEVYVPCGKCVGCLSSKRFNWCTRMQIELKSSPVATFITLTYNPQNLPQGNKPSVSHVQKFLKRLRNVARDFGCKIHSPIRYFLASEHGEKLGRVHYHAIIYGLDMFESEWQTSFHHFDNQHYPVFVSLVLSKVWNKGFCTVSPVTDGSIKYISDYIFSDSSSDDIHRYSQGLGVPFFCDYALNDRNRFVPSSLRQSAIQSVDNGFVTVGSLDRIRKIPTPSFLKRYLERFDTSLYERFRTMRKEFLRSSDRYVSPSSFEEHTVTLKEEQKRKKKL